MNLTAQPIPGSAPGGDAGKAAALVLDAEWLRALCREAGADDVGLVSVDAIALDGERESILRFFPATRTLVSFACRMNREPLRNPDRSVANVESHQTFDRVNEVGHKIVAALERDGVRAISTSTAFPMDMERASGRAPVSHKLVAVAAGVGIMGLHRLVIHPRFGNYILLGTVLLAAESSEYHRPLTDNPCLDCKLCVAACPTGAIAADGHFDFSSCFTHNYRDYFGGFTNWVEQLAESKNASDYRRKISDAETASVWQSLAHGGTYKCVHCMAVCPAGKDVSSGFLSDKAAYVDAVVRPLLEKAETVYVVPGSDAEAHVRRRFPSKRVKRVGNGLHANSVSQFLGALPLVFQREAATGLDATYHFTFRGEEDCRATVVIRDRTVRVSQGHIGTGDLRVTADSRWWIGFLAKDRNLFWGLLRLKLRLKGSPKLLSDFAKCFPS